MTQIVANNQVFNVDSDIAEAIDSARNAKERMDMKSKKKKPMMKEEEEKEYDEEEEEYLEDSDADIILDGLSELLDRTDAEGFRDVIDHIDSLEAQIEMLKMRSDSSPSDEDIDDKISERLDSILNAYAEAGPFLSDTFKLDGECTAHSIYTAALQHRVDGLNINWDSETAVETAFEMLKQSFSGPKTVTVAEALAPRSDMAMPSGPNRKMKPCTYSKDN